MNLLVEKIIEIATNIAGKNGFFLVDAVVRGTSSGRVVEIFLDGEKNITADDCAKISNELNLQLEKIPDTHSLYRLDVSSPGVDRPLKFLKQYHKHINRKFEIIYKTGDDENKISAILTGINGNDLIFSIKTEVITINFNNIITAKVMVSLS
jgi:ribosome maturation factor RimP